MKCKKDSISVPLKSDKVCIHIFFLIKGKIYQRQRSNKKCVSWLKISVPVFLSVKLWKKIL